MQFAVIFVMAAHTYIISIQYVDLCSGLLVWHDKLSYVDSAYGPCIRVDTAGTTLHALTSCLPRDSVGWPVR